MIGYTAPIGTVQSKITNQKSVLRSLVKRKRNDLCSHQLSAHVDFNSLTDVGNVSGHVSHANVLFEKWRWTSGSNVTSALAVDTWRAGIEQALEDESNNPYRDLNLPPITKTKMVNKIGQRAFEGYLWA